MALTVRRSVFVFLSAVLLSLLVVPFINILTAPDRKAIKWTDKTFIYNMDFASRWTARLLYPFGISTDPKQVIVGRDGWLFLGDQYEQTLTVDRRPPSKADFFLGEEIGRATEDWGAYLTKKGVKLFKVMIGPNKGTIYPEYLPFWARPSSPNATDALLAGTGTAHYIDLRGPLLAAKANHRESLYYKTDTHWNSLGAAVAFQAFAQQVGKVAPEIQWPSQNVYELKLVGPRSGGDLANFLRLSKQLSDSEPITYGSSLPRETTQFDFDTKDVLPQGKAPEKAVLVKSARALNEKKVLWLRDSFGTAMLPLMAATFSQVLEIHWIKALNPGGRFMQLVEQWKPDYVFFTVVERASRNRLFAAYPPKVLVPNQSQFKPIRTTIEKASNNLLKGHSDRQFKINGNDPFIDFALSGLMRPSEARYLSVDLVCDDGSPSVPLQLFWLEDGRPFFDEENSAKVSFLTGNNLIDLRTIPKLSSATSISRIRLDIDSRDYCLVFNLGAPYFSK